MSDQNFQELPKAHTTYANIIKSMLPVGDKRASKQDLPTSTYRVSRLVIDDGNLREYRKICGFMKDGRVPVTYFAVLSQALQMNMMAKPDFPFVMLGLVHIANRVTQYRPIFDTEVASLSVRLDNLASHDKGQQFDFITEVMIGNELVWQGSSTYLSRQKKSSEEREAAKNKPKPEPAPKLIVREGGFSVVIDVAEDIGRRYAFVSGDFNLIHLHPLSAKAFGFPRAIAHGMWSKACALAKIKNLPDSFSVDVEFKQPIFLPSSVELVVTGEEGGERNFGMYGVKNDKPHLIGKICAVNAKPN